jgi:hypothetical protein
MKVNVNTYLNARIGKPSTSALCIDFRMPGEFLDIDSVLIGDEINGNAIWYKNKTDNCFYWSEGIAEQSFLLENGDIFAKLNEADKHTFLRSFIYAFQSAPQPDSKVLGMGVARLSSGIGLAVDTVDGFSDAELNLKAGQLIFRGAIIPFKVSPATDFKSNIYADTDTPFVLGGSISNKQTGETGSRGIKVTRNGQSYLLTCYHVACYSLMKERITEYNNTDVEVLFPSDMSPESTVSQETSEVSEGVLNMYFDYAAVRIADDLVINIVPDQSFINKAYTRSDYNKLTVGAELSTFGCITGPASGKITKINQGKTNVRYDFVGNISIMETIETEQISVPGDSGAPVFDVGMNLVGLIIANNPKTKRSLIMPIHQLFFNKSFSI